VCVVVIFHFTCTVIVLIAMSLCELLDGCVLCKAKLACVELKPILVTVLLLLHPFNGLSSRTTWVSWYQKGKSSLHLLRSEMMGF